MRDPVGALVVAVVLAVTPGADTMLVLGRAFRHGRGDALRASLGVAVGLTMWAAASAAGLAALLTASNLAYDTLRLLGAAYLIGMGSLQFVRAVRQRQSPSLFAPHPDPVEPQSGTTTAPRPFVAGLTTNLLNPKVGIFYLTFLPQLTPEGSAVGPISVAVAAAHIAFSWGWLSGLAAAGSRAASSLRPLVRRRLEMISGGLLVAFGARVALARR